MTTKLCDDSLLPCLVHERIELRVLDMVAKLRLIHGEVPTLGAHSEVCGTPHREGRQLPCFNVLHKTSVLPIGSNEDVDVQGVTNVACSGVNDPALGLLLDLDVLTEVVRSNERGVRHPKHGTTPRVSVVVHILGALGLDMVISPPPIDRRGPDLDVS